MGCPLAGPIPSDPGPAGEGLYAKVIDGAYDFASRCLMDLVVREVCFVVQCCVVCFFGVWCVCVCVRLIYLFR